MEGGSLAASLRRRAASGRGGGPAVGSSCRRTAAGALFSRSREWCELDCTSWDGNRCAYVHDLGERVDDLVGVNMAVEIDVLAVIVESAMNFALYNGFGSHGDGWKHRCLSIGIEVLMSKLQNWSFGWKFSIGAAAPGLELVPRHHGLGSTTRFTHCLCRRQNFYRS